MNVIFQNQIGEWDIFGFHEVTPLFNWEIMEKIHDPFVKVQKVEFYLLIVSILFWGRLFCRFFTSNISLSDRGSGNELRFRFGVRFENKFIYFFNFVDNKSFIFFFLFWLIRQLRGSSKSWLSRSDLLLRGLCNWGFCRWILFKLCFFRFWF